MVEKVSILALLGAVAAADHVQCQAAIEQLVEGGEFARSQGWCDEAGAMCQQQAEATGGQPGQGGDQEAVRLIGPVADQDTVEAGVFMGLGEGADVLLVEHRPDRGNGFGGKAMADHAEDLNAHGDSCL
ncbi:hypothetical protein D3C81_1051320 [compost metagenome]